MMSNYLFVSCMLYSMVYESISHSTDMTQTSYIQRPMYDPTETETKGIFGSKF